MLLFLLEDANGWIYEPHGEEELCYNLAFEGSELLRAAGWCYISMHRVSRYLHESLLIDGLLTLHKTKASQGTLPQNGCESCESCERGV